MEPWYKFILYGTYDGFSRSTLGDDNLYLVLENGEKVEVPRCFVKNASDFIEKDKLKLKDVIARIKKLDLGTQKVWLNEILNELGSDYGTLKYKAGYEQGKVEGEWVCQQLKDADKIRQEINKPVVPQFVADWYEEYKGDLEYNVWEWFVHGHKKSLIGYKREFFAWLNSATGNPIQTLVNMHQFGYTVEKERRYLVKIKGVACPYLNHDTINELWFYNQKIEGAYTKTQHTRKELEEANFGWVFDCPGIELEEVENE
nr:MAG TPA: Protein of unknown function (DUF1642) [Caudoviricetes sp.]